MELTLLGGANKLSQKPTPCYDTVCNLTMTARNLESISTKWQTYPKPIKQLHSTAKKTFLTVV